MNERWLICGGRTFGRIIAPDSPADVERAEREAALLTDQLDILVSHFGAPSVVITGGAPGADTLADDWRKARGYPGQVFKADWDAQPRRAGIIRNTQMLTVLRVVRAAPKRVIAFKGTEGTLNMIQQAMAAGIAVTKVGW